jgi:hypothetical protein
LQNRSLKPALVTLAAAKQHYEAGLLTATGLVYYAITIQRSPGWKIRLFMNFRDLLEKAL